ncbi:amidase domain-containing protein [Clostridium thermarum]|uniref:amidase domain-containing protein n=1 Tax=Clostridium thermarum TaxID=1716543 RepID=UPI0011202C9C|nr:amidase domain-containing protein [Clostridium thermarum]
MFRKLVIMLFITLGILLLDSTVVKSQRSDNTDIRNCIDSFLKRHFKAYETLDNSNNENMAQTNDELYIFQKAHSLELKFLKELELGYRDLTYNVEYTNFVLDKDKALVETLVDMNFRYKRTPEVQSGIYNVRYEFNMTKDKGIWIIDSIKSDYEKYQIFLADVNEKQLKAYQMGFRSGLSKRKATDIVANEYIEEIYRNKAEKAGRFEQFFKKKADRVEDEGEKGIKGTGYINFDNSKSASYEVGRGGYYALKFAEAPLSERLFYTAKSDCTNFVSQCIWAAYGGYVIGDDIQVVKNIRNRYRMTPQWHGNSGGGTPPWENVERLHAYLSGIKELMGVKVYINNANKPAISLEPSTINPGDALQFRRGKSGSYTHSAYVTSNIGIGEFNGIFVCQHSTDWKNRNLEDLILSPGWGGYDKCYVRHMSFEGTKRTTVQEEAITEDSLSIKYSLDITEDEINEGKELVKRYFQSINKKDYDAYRSTLGSYRKMRDNNDIDEFVNNRFQFQLKEIRYPGSFHDMAVPPHSYEKVFNKKPYVWMYLYVLVEKKDPTGNSVVEELDFILVREEKEGPWLVHDVGV